MKRAFRRLLGALVLAALLPACGGGDDPDVAPTVDGSVAAGEDLASRIESFLAEREQQAYELTERCMRDSGYALPFSLNAAGGGAEDFRDRFGYGISTLAGVDPPRGGSGADRAQPDPQAIAALAGEPETISDEPGAVNATDFGGGCMGRAYATVFGEPEPYEALFQALEELEQQVWSDPSIADAITAWSACVLEMTGRSFESPAALLADLSQRADVILSGPPASSGSGTPPSDDDEAATGAPANANAFGEELSALQEEELALARADRECAAAHLDGVLASVRSEHERAWESENEGLLLGIGFGATT